MTMTVERCELLEVLAETADRLLARARVDGGGPVVLKLLKHADAAPADVARLHHEFAIASGLPDGAVVRPLRVETFGRQTGLVLADTGGQSLATLLGGRMDITQALRVGLSLARSLAAVHAAEVIHRDIKPANIVVDPDGGGVRLIDFGVATRLRRLRPSSDAPTRLEGSLAYLAPEQTGRLNRSVDHRADLYAVGVTLYQMLTGRLPFAAANALELVHAHLAQTPPAPGELDPAIPPAASAVVMRLLAKAPEDRYQSATGLVHDIERILTAGAGEAFVPGAADAPARLDLPERLYGRAGEAAALAGLVEEVANGASAFALLRGPAGVGKTALVGELHAPVAAHRGHLVTGKFEQFTRDVPYASVVEAFTQLVRHILAEPDDRLADRRRALLDALGDNAGVIAEVIPDLRLIVGEVPPPSPLGPIEAQNRFNLTFARFVGVFTGPGRPLVVFLDDLHWADTASLRLIGTLVNDSALSHLLVIGAYRPAEVSAAHPLTVTVDALPADLVRHVDVGPLSARATAELVADALRAEGHRAEPLAHLLHDRSGGNPFYLGQILLAAADDRLIRFEDGRWAWNLAALRAAAVPDDVVEYMVNRLAGLPASCRRALQIGALVGATFDIAVLSEVLGEPPADTASRLWPAIAAGLLLPVGDSHELLGAGLREARVTYAFLHDRVQQACHSTIARDELPELHLRIGRTLRALADEAGSSAVFEVVDHLTAAVALLDDAERRDLARLGAVASARAKASLALETSRALAEAALDTWPGDIWADDYPLALELHGVLGAMLGASGRGQEAEQVLATAIARAADDVDAANTWSVLAETRLGLGDVQGALDAATAGLGRMGVRLDAADLPAVLARVLDPDVPVRLLTQGQGDERAAAVGRLLQPATICAYVVRPDELPLISAVAVDEVLRAGVTPTCALGVAWFANVALLLGHIDVGLAIGEAAVVLAERAGEAFIRGRVNMIAWHTVICWCNPLESYIAVTEESYRLSLSAGDFQYASFQLWMGSPPELLAGRSCTRLLLDVERWLDSTRVAMPFATPHAEVRLDQARRLAGADRTPCDAEAIVTEYERAADQTNSGEALFELGRVAMLFGEYEDAYRHVVRAEAARLAGATGSALWTYLYDVTAAVAAARMLAQADSADARAEYRQRLDSAVARIEPFAARNGGFAGPYATLVEAEAARAAGDHDAAVAAYTRTIAGAAAWDYPLLEGWANELLGRLHAERGRPLATAHLREARALYIRCGALGKVERLDAEFPDAPAARRASFDSTRTGTGEDSSAAELASVLRASRAFAAEVAHDRVVEQLVAVAVDTTGAQHGTFLPPDDTSPAPPDTVDLPVGRNDVLAGTVRLEFAADPDPDRLALLRLLVPQMAISLENARLYADLEAQVAQRSAELAATLDDLRLMQDQIVTSEKLAALGGLVAGVAHEVATPVGVALTAAGYLGGQAAELEEAMASGRLRRAALDGFLSRTAEAGELILQNLLRAADLVSSFKQVAVDQSSEAPRTFDVAEYLHQILASLAPRLAGTLHTVDVDCAPGLEIAGHPGALAQVVTNLVVNSLTHAYKDGEAGILRLAVDADAETVRIRYSDDGRGIAADALPRIFEPFFTTDRAAGGSGLGLHIVHNLVTSRLGGTILAESAGRGTTFVLTLPRTASAGADA